jgi:hypothetical protein
MYNNSLVRMADSQRAVQALAQTKAQGVASRRQAQKYNKGK